jgi:hypothetical protein
MKRFPLWLRANNIQYIKKNGGQETFKPFMTVLTVGFDRCILI